MKDFKNIYLSLGVILAVFLAIFVLVENNNKVLLGSVGNVFNFEIIQLDRGKAAENIPTTVVAKIEEEAEKAEKAKENIPTTVVAKIEGVEGNIPTTVATKIEEKAEKAEKVKENTPATVGAKVEESVAKAEKVKENIPTTVVAKIEEKAEEAEKAMDKALEKAQEQKELVATIEPKEKVAEVDHGINQAIEAIGKQKEAINLVNVTDAKTRKDALDTIERVSKEVAEILTNQQMNIFSVKDDANELSMDRVEGINNEIMQIISGQQPIIDSMFGFEKEREVMNSITSLATEIYQGGLSGEDAIEKYVSFYESYNQVISDYYESPEMQESLLKAREQIHETIKESSVSREEVETIEQIQDPREKGPVLRDIFGVRELAVQEKRYRADGSEDIGKLAISGFGPPSSLIFLFLYSTPIMVHTETDNNGFWNYILEVELNDGSHEMYVASIDRAGNIIARSDAVPFVKEAAAVQLDFMPISLVGAQSVEFLDRKNITAISLVFLFILIVTIILTGMSVSKKQYFQE